MRTIPESVDFNDFQAAIKPLLDLCGVDANEVMAEIHITPGETSFQVISFMAVPGAEFTIAEPGQGLPQHSVYVVPVTVKVV